jgi:hypothetical protein
MNIPLTERESLDLIISLWSDIRNKFSARHYFRRPCGSFPACPDRTAGQYLEIRHLVALSRKLELARERKLDRLYHRPRCRDMAELRRRNAVYRTRQRIKRDARSLKFSPLQQAA